VWIIQLDGSEQKIRIVWREINHRVLGKNRIPAEIYIDDSDTALRMIGKKRDAETFAGIVHNTEDNLPVLLQWLEKYPLRALNLADAWANLLSIVLWIQQHPRPNIYLRQIDLPGVHTKFIDQHRGVLSELLDMALTPEQIDKDFCGIHGFARRYGFMDKPLRVRFRILDPSNRFLPGISEQDIALTRTSLAEQIFPVKRVFITENEVNFLAFPNVPDSILLFGSGYGFESLALIPWLFEIPIFYWGDIDTHGFAILNQLRILFPHTISFLMNRDILEFHHLLWVLEEKQTASELLHLTSEESTLYNDLRFNRLGVGVRLEQERIGYANIMKEIERLSITQDSPANGNQSS